MRITGIQSIHADGGWRPFSFLKMTTDEGLTGWSEYSCGMWAPALPRVIETLGQHLIGRDPRDFSLLRRELSAMTKFAAGGLNCQALAALENACIDLAAKSADLPVWRYFGGAIRSRVDLYWTHCGSFRARDPQLFERLLGCEPLVDLEAVQRLGREIVSRGFRAAKTNPIEFTPSGPRLLNPGFVPQGLDHSGSIEPRILTTIEAQLEAFRDGAGVSTELMLDVNFAYSPEALVRLERRLRKYNLRWLEYDHLEPAAVARAKRELGTPLASLEAVYETSGYKAFLDHGALDIAVVDVLWNGFAESIRVAELCKTYAVNVAPHNFYGPLADLIAANFCAVVPNLEIMEFEADDVPWKYSLLSTAPSIESGQMSMPTGPGWGSDPNEDALTDRPWSGTM